MFIKSSVQSTMSTHGLKQLAKAVSTSDAYNLHASRYIYSAAWNLSTHMTEAVAEQVLAEAQAIDASKAAGNDTGPLCGLPFAVKDNIDVVGYATVAGTPGLEGAHVSVQHSKESPVNA